MPRGWIAVCAWRSSARSYTSSIRFVLTARERSTPGRFVVSVTRRGRLALYVARQKGRSITQHRRSATDGKAKPTLALFFAIIRDSRRLNALRSKRPLHVPFRELPKEFVGGLAVEEPHAILGKHSHAPGWVVQILIRRPNDTRCSPVAPPSCAHCARIEYLR